MSGIPKSARPHHWGFANAWLRSSFQRIPETMVSAIAKARSADPVVDAWERFAKTLDEEDRLAPEGMAASTYTTASPEGDWYIAVVEFPAPENAHEAYMAALAVRPADDRLRPDEEDEAPRDGTDHRYLLVERTGTPGEGQWVAWEGDEREPIDTPGCVGKGVPEPEVFVRTVTDLLE